MNQRLVETPPPPSPYTIHYAAYLANGATFLLLFKDDDPLDTTFFSDDGMLRSTSFNVPAIWDNQYKSWNRILFL